MYSPNRFAAIMWLIVLATIGFAGAQSGLSHPGVAELHSSHQPPSAHQPYRQRTLTTRLMANGIPVLVAAENRMASGGGLPSKTVTLPAVFLSDAMVLSPSTQTPLRPEIPQLSTSTLESRFHRIHTLYTTYTHYNDMQPSASTPGQRHSLKIVSNVITAPASRVITTVFSTKTRLISVSSVPSEAASGETHQHASSSTIEVTRVVVTEAQQLASETVKRQTTSPFHTEFGQKLTAIKSTTLSHASQQVKNGISTQTAQPSSLEAHKIPNLSSQVSSYFSTTSQPVPELINTKLDKQTFSDKSQQQKQHNTSGTTGSPADAAASASAFLSAATYLDKAHLYNSAQFQPALYVNHDALSANFPSSQEIDLEEAGSGVALTSEPTLQTLTPVVTLSSASLENQTPQAVDSIKNIYSPAITSDVASPAIHTSPAPSGIVLHAANVDPIAAPPATATTTESSSAFSLTNIAGGLLGLGGLGAASMSGLGFGSGLVDTAAGIIRNVLPIAARRDGEVHSDDVRPNRIPFDRLTPPRGSASFQQFDNNELRRKRIISRRKNNGYLAVRGPNGQIIGPLAEEKYGHSVVFAQPQRRVNPPQAHSSSSKHSDFRKRPGSLYGNKIFRPSLHNRRPLASHRKQDSFVPTGFIAIVPPSSETKQSTVSQGRPEFNHDLLSHKHTHSYRPTRLESLVSNKRAPSVEMKAPPRPITPRQDAVISEYRPGFDVLLKSSTRYSTITQVNDHRIISTLANTSNQIHATPLSIFAYDHRTVGITDRLDEKVNDLNKGPYLYLRNTPDTISLTSIVDDEFAEENDFVDRTTEDDQQLAASVFDTNHSESGSSDEWVAAFDNSLEVDLSSSQPDDFQEKTTDRPGFVSTLHTIASVEGVNRIVGTNVFASVVPMVTRPGVIRFYESNEATTLPSPQTTRVLPTKTKTRPLFRQSVTLIEPVTDELSTEGFSRLPPPLFNDIETTTKNLNPFQRKISTTQTNWFDKYNPVSEEYSDVQQASADNSNTFITRIRSQDEVVEELLGSNIGNRLDVGTTISQYTTESTPLTPVSIDITPGAGQTVLYSSVEQLPTHTVEYKNSAEFRSESTPALVTKSRETISNTLQSSTPAVNESQSRRRLITRLVDRIKQTLRQSIQGKRQNVRSSVAQKRFTLSNRHQHTTTIRAEYTPQNYAGTRVFNGLRWPSVKSTSSSSSSQPSRAVQQIIPENSNILSHRPPLENLDSIDHTVTDLDTGKNSPHLSITTGSSTTILGPDAKNLHPETRTTKRLDTTTFIVGSSTVFKQEFTRPALPVQNIHEITEINHGPDALQTIHITRTEHLTRTVTATKTEVRLSGASTVTKTSLITSILTPITIVSTVIGSSTAVATLNTATPTRLVQLVKPTAVTAPATLPDISETSTEGQTSTKQQTKESKLDGRTETITNPTYIVSERDSEDNTDVHKGVRENSEVNRVVLNPGIQRQVVVDRPAVVTDSCKTPCRAALNLACRKYSGGYQCVCKPGYAKSRSDGSCEETSTYVLQILLDRVRNLPLTYRRHFRDSTTREHKALSTLTKTGVEESLNHSPFSERVQNVALMDYKSTRFTGQKFEHVENGLVAELMVQVTKSTGDKNTEQVQLEHSLLRSIARRNFSLGDKDLIVSRHTDAITALDFDECQDSEYHDCHDYAICRNLAGSFTCSCRSGMTDLGEPQRPGRICSAESADCTECSSHGHCYLSPSDSSLSCRCRRWYAGDRCQINLHVLLTAVLVLAAILSFLLCYCCYMCCRRKRHNHTAPPMVFTGADGFLRHRSSSIHPGLERRAMLDSSSSDTSAASPHTLMAAPFDARKPHAIPTPLHIDCNPTVTTGVDTVDGYRRTGGIVSRMSSGRTAATSCYQEDRSLASVGVANAAAQMIPRVTKYYARRRQRSSNDDRSSAAATEVEGSACQGSSQLWSRSNHGAGASRSHAMQRHLLSRLNPSTTAGREQWRAASESSNGTSASSRRQDTGVSLNPSGGVARRSRSSETGGYQADTSRACSRAGIRPAAAVAHAVFRERTMSEARSFDETTVRPSVRSYPSGSAVGGATTTSHRSSLAFSDTQTYTDDRHTMAERDEASTFVTPVRQLFRPIIDSDSASHLSHDSLCLGYGPYR